MDTRGRAPSAGYRADMGGLLEGWHPIVLIAIALIVFGPGKLPEVMAQLGRGVREFRAETTKPAALPEPGPRDQSS